MITRLITAAAAAAVLLCTGAGWARACPCAVRPVAAPAGAHPVGRTEVVLTDAGRVVVASVWYPSTMRGTAPYIPASNPIAAVRIAAEAAEWMHTTPATARTMIAAVVDAAEGAPVDTRLGRLPVVVMSPGLGTPRWILSSLAEDAASRGSIAVAMDHLGESPAVELPGGRIVVGDGTRPDDAGYMRARLDARLADTRLILDRLPTLPIVGTAADLERVAMLGHSYGGLTAVQTMSTDARVRAAVMVDAPAGWSGVAGPVDPRRPVLALQLTTPWPSSWARQTGADAATVLGAAHYSATDLCSLGAAGDAQLCGTITPDRATAVCRGVIERWLDRQLLGDAGPRFAAPELHWQP
ncbi:platelet-activating factor acetylhydrolase-like protein [Nocardia nova SH22a]|uniref:Platelet-activating factor acetylhydrolase-like protein n=1 Tax=Nocardia nova SH22a TaxID=1415166 RepID=W5TH91_9NOCA|nr:hypothetical protein [Nocardia nova]AHH16611.1 platelet-activating factor acetylhydrolase-like protein [Nocardia nova SH22a]